MQVIKVIALTALLLLAVAASATASPPRRVVSMNVCTDQLAMLMAAEGQLHSVSDLALDPSGSVMHEEAKGYAINHGLAEEIFVMKPDLVLAGTFTSRATTEMLKRLNFRVEEFPPSYTFDEIRAQILRLGVLLGREARADEMVSELDRRLAAALPQETGRRPLAALYYANSYTSGEGSLAAHVVEQAGFVNLGSKLGLKGTVRVPLEILVLSAPDLIISDRANEKDPAQAFEPFRHPALRRVLDGHSLTGVPDKYWVCGAPFTAEAVAQLARWSRP